MDRKLSASIKSLIYILEKNSKFNFKALIGFDGFIIEHLNAVKSGNNLNDYTIDIRTNSFIIFIKDNNTLKIYNNIKDCSLEILFNGNMIGKFNIYQKYINFIESINDETRDWNIENSDYLNIEVGTAGYYIVQADVNWGLEKNNITIRYFYKIKLN